MMPVNIHQDSINQQLASEPNCHSLHLHRIANVKMEDDMADRKISLPPVPDKCGPPTISLALLMDFAVQHTFHEITILSELLPKKKETDRKISVVQFAHSTRIIFVKLLAIVKWIRISKRFEPLAAIRYFLDQQAGIFVDTADRLVLISRDELPSARLPIFQVPQSVDVLTLGAYPRLPQDIKDRFIFKPALSQSEQALTLYRLNHIIEYQLLRFSHTLSPRINSVIVKNGMVILKVSGEFEICLTLLNEDEPLTWCLLNVKIIVENSDVGFGQKLVHPLQVNFLHQIIQEKLRIGPKPLYDAYVIIHTFCQSLQLDVLYCQVVQMSSVSQYYLKVEEYDRVKSTLVISYWLSLNNKKKLTSLYKITIYADSDDWHNSLKTRHHPPFEHLPVLDNDDNDSDCLSISRLIGETIVLRCRERLLRIKDLLESIPPHTLVNQTGNSLMTLNYSLIAIGRRLNDESLEVSIDNFLGTVVCQIRSIGRTEELTELEILLNNNTSVKAVSKILDRLRIMVMIERFNKAICGLQVRNLENQLIAEAQVLPLLSKLKQLPADRRVLQFNREEQYFLVVAFVPDKKVGVSLDFYLISSINGKCNMMQLDAEELIKSSPIPTIGLPLDSKDQSLCSQACDKAKMKWIGSPKQLQVAVASIDDRLVFLTISEELDKRNIKYKPLMTEPLVGGHLLKIINAPSAAVNIKNTKYCEDFFNNLVGCSLRLDLRQNLSWPFECTMINCPISADNFNYNCETAITADNSYSGSAFTPSVSVFVNKKTSCTWVQHITSQSTVTQTVSEAVTYNIIERLSIYCHVYGPIKQFSHVYESLLKKYCTVQVYTYHKFVLAYGEDRNYLLILSWRPKNFMMRKAQYVLNFGQCENVTTIRKQRKSTWNPHILMTNPLAEKFNENQDLVGLVWYLVNTYKSLETIYNFSRAKLHSVKTISQVMMIDAMFPVELQCYLNVISETKLRLTYGSTHIEFCLLTENNTGVRDCLPFNSTVNQHVSAVNRPLGLSPQMSGTISNLPTSNSLLFEAFWRRIACGHSLSAFAFSSSFVGTEHNTNLTRQKLPSVDRNTESPYHVPPNSFPSHQKVNNNSGLNNALNFNNSPPSTISQRQTLSVPNLIFTDASTSTNENNFNTQSVQTGASDQFTPNNIVVSHLTLERAMSSLTATTPSALENYLYGLTYLSRLYSVIDASRRAMGINHLPVREVQYNILMREQLQLSLTIFGFQLPNIAAKEPCLLRFRVFINPLDNFRLSAKLECSGTILPSESDVRIFERYFELHVVELFNEMAALTFITICRLASSPSIFSSFAQLMLVELDPNVDTRWLFNLQLTTWTSGNETAAAAAAASNQRKVQCGVIVNESCKQFLIMVSFRSVSKPSLNANITLGSDRRAMASERCPLTLVYNVLSNDLSLRQPQNVGNCGTGRNLNGTIDEPEIRNILKTQSQNSNIGGSSLNCSIWPSIVGLLEGFNNAAIAAENLL